jgi:hypothetical protein
MDEEMAEVKRKGDWMQTYSGRQFWPLDPRPEDIHIEDIAAALSKMCRYSGHCLQFYSVAEHCVHAANAAPRGMALTALLHDASEAYLCDIIRPIKSSLTNYLDIERRLEGVIAARFNTHFPMPEEVRKIDQALLHVEMLQIMAPPPAPWHAITEPPLDIELQCWEPNFAKAMFMDTFYYYGGK